MRLRGLPYSATSRDVINLLHDCKVTDSDKGIRFSFAPDGRPSGEAFVELASEEDVSKALEHNNEHMGKRYVEIFKATKGQLEWEGRMAEKVGGGTGGVVRLRGLPYRCTEEDIRQFFQGLGSLRRGLRYYSLLSVYWCMYVCVYVLRVQCSCTGYCTCRIHAYNNIIHVRLAVLTMLCNWVLNVTLHA